MGKLHNSLQRVVTFSLFIRLLHMNGVNMKTHLNEKSNTSKNLLGFAWGFEIACVTFGLLAATSITLTALLDENGEFNLGLKGLLIAMPIF